MKYINGNLFICCLFSLHFLPAAILASCSWGLFSYSSSSDFFVIEGQVLGL